MCVITSEIMIWFEFSKLLQLSSVFDFTWKTLIGEWNSFFRFVPQHWPMKELHSAHISEIANFRTWMFTIDCRKLHSMTDLKMYARQIHTQTSNISHFSATIETAALRWSWSLKQSLQVEVCIVVARLANVNSYTRCVCLCRIVFDLNSVLRTFEGIPPDHCGRLWSAWLGPHDRAWHGRIRWLCSAFSPHAYAYVLRECFVLTKYVKWKVSLISEWWTLFFFSSSI